MHPDEDEMDVDDDEAASENANDDNDGWNHDYDGDKMTRYPINQAWNVIAISFDPFAQNMNHVPFNTD